MSINRKIGIAFLGSIAAILSPALITFSVKAQGFLDLAVIKTHTTGTKSTEVHILSGASNFQSFILQTGTALFETRDKAAFTYDMGDWNKDGKSDLIVIKKSGTGTKSTEVHILSRATNFKSFLLQTGTPLPETGSNSGSNFAFSVPR